MSLNTGEVVGERYRVARLLGQGGMGAVYRAWDTRLNRAVALKELIPQSSLDMNLLLQLRQQFQQEAQILATLVHPNLVRVTDYFSWGGNEYLVMDFVEGESLAERIEREGAQPETRVLAWAGQLFDALIYCHKQGLIHRDIKPQNIIVTPEDRAVLVDFGLVKLWDPRDPRTRTVMRGAGTPEYAPPEQYDLGLGHTDPRSDVYSLGATFYHVLTGQAPPTATQRMANPSCFAPPRRVNAAVTPATETVVLKALGIAMEHRYQNAQEMAQAWGFTPRPAPVTLPRVTPGEVPAEREPPAKRKRGILLGLSGVGLAMVGLLCLALTVGAILLGSLLSRPPAATPLPATPTPPPTSTPEAETGGILLQDDFSDPGSGWEVGDYTGGSVGYKDGIYFVRGEEDGSTMWGVAHRSFDDLIIEVDATQVLAPANNNNAYGVKCREQPNGGGYGLVISGDGYYSIQIVVEGDWNPLVEWTRSDVIRQGNDTNHIRAVCDGTHLALAVNGELLAEAEDTTYAEGDIGLAATTLEEGEPTEVHFDHLVVYAP